MTKATLRVEISGDFFKKDPALGLRANIRDMLAALADEMESEVQGLIGSFNMPRSKGWSVAHTEGYTTSPRTGRHWQLWAAVGAVTAGMGAEDAIRTKAAAARIERRWHPYRNVRSAVRRSRAVISADLTKGLQ